MKSLSSFDFKFKNKYRKLVSLIDKKKIKNTQELRTSKVTCFKCNTTLE